MWTQNGQKHLFDTLIFSLNRYLHIFFLVKSKYNIYGSIEWQVEAEGPEGEGEEREDSDGLGAVV